MLIKGVLFYNGINMVISPFFVVVGFDTVLVVVVVVEVVRMVVVRVVVMVVEVLELLEGVEVVLLPPSHTQAFSECKLNVNKKQKYYYFILFLGTQ